ncbi:hypothetical protein M0805_007123 [Coniferiporia weirii]|nr:hypothetical protein M0805_007123 [Coniferiporia weirii]
MWIIEGAFDGEPGNLEKQSKHSKDLQVPSLTSDLELKLLKPGRAYPLGRKAKHPFQLVLSHPKVSGEHVTFVVGEHLVDQIDDPGMKPVLKILNHKSRILQVNRERKERVVVQPLAEEFLLSGDVIALVTGIYVSVWWRPVCCYAPPKTPSIPFDKCASLGIKIVSTPRPEITHHLTQLLDTTQAIATSLLNSTHLVRPDWLTELLHLGETAASADLPSVLETDFRLPAEKQHRPSFSPSLPAPLKSYTLWEVSDVRMGLLKGWRLVFIGEKGRELDIETRTLVERGQGEYEAFDVDGGATRLRQAIARNKRKSGTEAWKGISIIGNPETLKVAAGDLWDAMQDVLKSSDLRIIDHVQLTQAVLYSDTTRIDSSLNVNSEQESSLPDGVPNTYPEESSHPSRSSEGVIPLQDPESAPRARLPRRVAPRTTTPATGSEPMSVQPAPEQDSVPVSDLASSRMNEEPENAKRKRPLVRRTRANAVPPPILGIDDPSSIISQPPELDSAIIPAARIAADTPASEKPPSSSSTPLVRSGRLKRRARTAVPLDPILAELEQEIAEAMTQQPPLKRFKALFDETDPDRVASEALGSAFSGGIVDSQMFSQLPTESGGAGLSEPPMAVVPEEVEESQPVQASRVEAEGVPMEDEDDGPLSPRKNRSKPTSTAVASSSQSQMPPVPFSSTQVSKRVSSKVGAAPGKPDTDAAFLKALASTKKGKRREDDFDREFNNLRISKPEHGNVEAEDWRVLADFGDESNLMGNFMVIVEMDVPANKSRSRTQSREPEKLDWQGKPDFKKFKKKTLVRQRPAVELTVEDENDYGMGVAYWKGGSQSQSQSQHVSQNEPTTTQRHGYLQPSQTQNRGFLQPDTGSEPSTLGTKPRSQSQPRARGSQANAQAPGRRGRSRGLQVVSEEEESEKEAQPAKKGRTGVNGKGKGKEKSQPLFLEAIEEGDGESERPGLSDGIDLDLDLDGLSDDDPGEPTLRSTARSGTAAKAKSFEATVAPKRTTTTKKRSAALLDDDSDTGVVFKGFGGRKKAKVKWLN